jgi:hypothetical protein
MNLVGFVDACDAPTPRQRTRTRTQFNTPSMSADLQHEHPFDIDFATGLSMNFPDLGLSQSAFLNPGQLLYSESTSDLKVESSPAPRRVLYPTQLGVTLHTTTRMAILRSMLNGRLLLNRSGSRLRRCFRLLPSRSCISPRRPRPRLRWKAISSCGIPVPPALLTAYPYSLRLCPPLRRQVAVAVRLWGSRTLHRVQRSPSPPGLTGESPGE